MQRRVALLLIAAAILASVFFVAAQQQLSPTAQYFGPDGSLRLHGNVDPALLDYLTRGPHGMNLTRYVLVGDGFATARLVAINPAYLPPNERPYPGSVQWVAPGELLQGIFSELVRELRDVAQSVLSFFVQDARAAPLPTFSSSCVAGSTTSPVSCSVSISPGQAVVVFTLTNTGTRAVTDTGGNSYSELANTSGQNSVWAVIATSGATSVSFSSSGTVLDLIVLVYSNVQAFMLGSSNQINSSGNGFQVQTRSPYAVELTALYNSPDNISAQFTVGAGVTTRVSYQSLGSSRFGWAGSSSITAYGISVATSASWPTWGNEFSFGAHVELIPLHMAYRVDQNGGSAICCVPSILWSPPSGTQQGDRMVVFMNNSSPVTGISDNFSDSFTALINGTPNGYWIWTATAGGANPVITITVGAGGGAFNIASYIFRGGPTSGSTSSATGTGLAVSVSITTSRAFNFVIGDVAVVAGGGSSGCSSASQTSLIATNSGSGAIIQCSGDSNSLTPASTSWSATMTVSLTWTATAVELVNPNNCLGSCFWIGGTGSWTDGAHWSTSSGGASCGCIPDNLDNVTFDANSATLASTVSLTAATIAGAVTINNANVTLDATASNFSMNLAGLTITTGAYNARGSTVTTTGNWDTSAGTINNNNATPGSTIVFASSATLKTSGTYSLANQNFYALTINAGATVSMVSDIYYNGTSPSLTVNGILDLGGHLTGGYDYVPAPGVTGYAGNGIVRNGTDSQRTNNTDMVFGFGPTLQNVAFNPTVINVPYGAARTYTLQGPITVGSFTLGASGGGVTQLINWVISGSFTVLGSMSFDASNEGASSFDFLTLSAGSSLTVSGNFTLGFAGTNPYSYIASSPTSTFTVAGNWSVASASASWSNLGTTIFTGTSSSITPDASLPGAEFGNLLIPAGAQVTFTNTLTFAALQTVGVLVVPTGIGSATVSLSGINLSADAGKISLANWTSHAFTSTAASSVFPITLSVSTADLLISMPPVQVPIYVLKDLVLVAVGQPGSNAIVPGPWTTHTITIYTTQPAPTGGCTGPDCQPVFISCAQHPFVLGVILACTTAIPATAANMEWWVDSQHVGSGTTFSSYVFVPGIARDVDVSLVLTTADKVYPPIQLSSPQHLSSPLNLVVYVALLLIVIVLATWNMGEKRGAWAGFDVHNLGHRQLAISVEEYPKGWRSYRQRNPQDFVRGSLRSRRFYSEASGTDLWVVRGRLKSNGEWATQTVRERIKRPTT